MELKSAHFVTDENRELMPAGVAPIERYASCKKCGEPVDLLEGPSASITAWSKDPESGEVIWSTFVAQHPNCTPKAE